VFFLGRGEKRSDISLCIALRFRADDHRPDSASLSHLTQGLFVDTEQLGRGFCGQ
jgi:hypothetical protein